MNLKLIDFAIKSYRPKLDDAGRARLAFFRGIWEIQQRFEEQASGNDQGGYPLPDPDTLDGWYWDEHPVLFWQPVDVDREALASCATQIARYLIESGTLDDATVSALASTDFSQLVEERKLAQAGREPGAWLEAQARRCSDDSQLMVLSLALRAMIEPAQQAVSKALERRLRDEVHDHLKQTRCPVCGCSPTIAYVGPTDASSGNAQRLYCGQCGHTWEFERIRCPQCGTQSPERLHYFNLPGDEAHRIHACVACGGYTRTVFADATSAVPFVPEVEDVVMAPLDALAQDGTLDKAVREHPERTYRPYGDAPLPAEAPLAPDASDAGAKG